MKAISISLILLLIHFFTFAQKEKVSALKLPTEFHSVRDFAMTADGKEAYVSVQSSLGEISAIVQLKKAGDEWKEAKLVSFSGKYKDLEPFLSKDGLRLYFASNRPTSDTSTQPKDFDIWYVERKSLKSKWGKAINLGAPVNTSQDEFYPSLSNNNNLYFTSNGEDAKGKDDIYFCKWNGDSYSERVSLGKEINSAGYEFNAFISQDETFLIYTAYNRKGGLGSGDMYISYKNKKGGWQQAENMGEKVNSRQMDYCPFYDSKNKTFYFTSKRVSFEDSYKFKSLKGLLKEINKDENGLSKIYKVQLNILEK